MWLELSMLVYLSQIKCEHTFVTWIRYTCTITISVRQGRTSIRCADVLAARGTTIEEEALRAGQHECSSATAAA
eukprot:COSAG01_NODE_29862_length_628_cov_0.563327_1_plen_73_part_10